MEKLTEALQQLHWSEAGAVIFGLIYVILAARESVWCWFWGILSTALWAYATYTLYDLYVDALLQVFYVCVSFFGIYQWMKGGQRKEELQISSLKLNQHFALIGGGLILSLLVGYFFAEYTQAASTYLDAFTTVFSIIATFMVVRKVLENWIYWIVVDAVYVYLYFTRGSILFTLLMVIYTVIAVFGYLEWKKKVAQASLPVK